MHQDLQKNIFSTQVDSLYKHTPTLVVAHPVAAALLLWFFNTHLSQIFIYLWYGSILLLAITRYISYWRYKNSKESVERALYWDNVFFIMSFLQGLSNDIFWIAIVQIDNPLNNAIIMAWMIGLSACAVVGYSANLKGLLAFCIPVVLPGIVLFAMIGDRLNIGFALGLLLYSLVIFQALLPVNKSIKDAITFNFTLEKEVEVRKQVEQKLLDLSFKDGLTGLSNRRHFDSELKNELNRAARFGFTIGLILLDIDYFKVFNDTYGHIAGDKCLQEVATTLAQVSKRSGELAARYGGEEFAVILPNTTKELALQYAQKIRQNVQLLNIPHIGSKIPQQNTLTISVGVCVVSHPDNIQCEDIIHQADLALYQAKQQGRNQVVSV
jgi:diguanylate cyclase (GGDEF)-like protein